MLKKLRMLKKLTQVDIAIYCGVSVNAYVSWEKGTSKPTEEHNIKLKELFGEYEKE